MDFKEKGAECPTLPEVYARDGGFSTKDVVSVLFKQLAGNEN